MKSILAMSLALLLVTVAWSQTPPTLSAVDPASSASAADAPNRPSPDKSHEQDGIAPISAQRIPPPPPVAAIMKTSDMPSGKSQSDSAQRTAQKSDANGAADQRAIAPSTAMNQDQPTFATLDTHRQGYLTLNDTANTPWLRAHFGACDADGDGRVTAREYQRCSR